MQQKQCTKNSDHNNHHEQQGNEIPPIERPTVAAICVWVFVFFSVLFWAFLRQQIPVQSEYIKIGIESMFSLSLVIVVIIQTYINFRQAKALDIQEKIFREQTEAMTQGLVISNRASVGVHSIEWNKGSGFILVRVENIGLVPAERIDLMVEVLAAFNLDRVQRDPGPDQVRGFLRFRLLDQDYGSTKLFRGNLPITRAFKVGGNLRPEEIRLIEAGQGNLTVRGRVSYQDGFPRQARQETEFIFYYTPEGNFWTPGAPDRLGAHFDMMGPADNERWGDEDPNQQDPE